MTQVVSVIPTIHKSAAILNGAFQKLKDVEEVLSFFESLNPSDTVLALMGGPGQNLFVRAQQMGLNVQRIPWFTLEKLEPGAAGADAEVRARALKDAWESDPGEFYPLAELDETIVMLRELTRVRLNIQEYRKMATLQYKATARDLEPIMPDAAPFAAMRTMFANPGMITGAKADEQVLETRITSLSRTLDIWSWLHPGKGTVLPEVKGLGPSLGGSLIGEILDIKRFPTPVHLRAYARFHVAERQALPGEQPTHFKADPKTQELVGYVGTFPRRRRGEVSSWNRYLNRAVWLWSTDQMPRYDHVWRDIYYHFKWQEMQAHPEAEGYTLTKELDDGSIKTKHVYRYTLGHLDKRAKRRTGSALLEYVWGLWSAGGAGQDVEQWFRTTIRNPTAPPETHSTWDQFLNSTIAGEVAGGLYEQVKQEADRRRTQEPQSEDEESED